MNLEKKRNLYESIFCGLLCCSLLWMFAIIGFMDNLFICLFISIGYFGVLFLFGFLFGKTVDKIEEIKLNNKAEEPSLNHPQG